MTSTLQRSLEAISSPGTDFITVTNTVVTNVFDVASYPDGDDLTTSAVWDVRDMPGAPGSGVLRSDLNNHLGHWPGYDLSPDIYGAVDPAPGPLHSKIDMSNSGHQAATFQTVMPVDDYTFRMLMFVDTVTQLNATSETAVWVRGQNLTGVQSGYRIVVQRARGNDGGVDAVSTLFIQTMVNDAVVDTPVAQVYVQPRTNQPTVLQVDVTGSVISWEVVENGIIGTPAVYTTGTYDTTGDGTQYLTGRHVGFDLFRGISHSSVQPFAAGWEWEHA